MQGGHHHVKSSIEQSVTSAACAWLQCEANPQISVTVALSLAVCKMLQKLSHPVPVLLHSTAASFQCLGRRSQCWGSSTFADKTQWGAA